MKRSLAACGLVLLSAVMLSASSFAADDAGSLLAKALDELVGNGYVGDNSAAARYLLAILEQEPEHVEAQWQLVYLQLVPLRNVPLSERVEALSALSAAFSRLATLAKKDPNRRVFLHYATAVHASFYNAYERALSEIDRAVALDPRSARYLTAKGRIQVDSGKWTGSDAEIEKGIATLNQARELLRTHPEPFLRDELYDFYLAAALADLSRPRWKEAAEHYEQFIAKARPSVIYAYALNNASRAYTKLGECGRARDAAEKALAVMKFGAAQSNKRYAEFCLEMQTMGLNGPQDNAGSNGPVAATQ